MMEDLKEVFWLLARCGYHVPKFSSNATESHVTLWNLNYGADAVKDNHYVIKGTDGVAIDVTKEAGDIVKEMANVIPLGRIGISEMRNANPVFL